MFQCKGFDSLDYGEISVEKVVQNRRVSESKVRHFQLTYLYIILTNRNCFNENVNLSKNFIVFG